MEFWSKGLGKKTINLSLAKGESLPSEGTVCLRGTMEEPVSWEYVMKLDGDDIVDFFLLLEGPTMADYLYDSPHRWQLYKQMVVGGVQLGLRVIGALLRRALGREVELQDVAIEVPPPSVRKKKQAAKAVAAEAGAAAGAATPAPEKPKERKPLRRRLSTSTTTAPTMHATRQPTRAAGARPE